MAGKRTSGFYPLIHRHVVEWILILLLLRGAYDVIKIMFLAP
jgi:hypothetical protein